MRVSVAFACLLALGCAHETKERPVASSPTPRASATPLPLPETAFTNDDERPRDDPKDDRFVPRRIGPSAQESGAHRWTGARVDLDVKGADIHDVLRLIADVGKVNIVVAGDVSGTITLKLKAVPWDQALDVVAKAKGLALEPDGNVIIVHAH